MKLYPIHVDLQGRRCVVVGAGAVAERKVATLRECGADVRLVAPQATPGLQRLAEDSALTWMRAPYNKAHLDGAFLVVAATDRPSQRGRGAGRAGTQHFGLPGRWTCRRQFHVARHRDARGPGVDRLHVGEQPDAGRRAAPAVGRGVRPGVGRTDGPGGRLRSDIKAVGDEAARRAAVQRVIDDTDVLGTGARRQSVRSGGAGAGMPLLVLGINHHSAPVEMREKLAIGDRELPRALAALLDVPAVSEGALLSTCNRTEAYAASAPGTDDPEDVLAEFLAGWHGLSRHEFDGHLYCYRDGAAANHLFCVAAGIDSMILGEPDIQRQVKQALEAAQAARKRRRPAQQAVPGGAGRRQAGAHRDRHRARLVLRRRGGGGARGADLRRVAGGPHRPGAGRGQDERSDGAAPAGARRARRAGRQPDVREGAAARGPVRRRGAAVRRPAAARCSRRISSSARRRPRTRSSP